MLNGQKFYFAGTNAFYAGSTDVTSDDQIRELFKVQSANGAKVVRTWAYVNGYGGGSVTATAHPIQPTIGEPVYLMHASFSQHTHRVCLACVAAMCF